MRCPQCGLDTDTLGIYEPLELPQEFADRTRWQMDPEHRATLGFYAWFVIGLRKASILDLGSGPGTVAIPLSRLPSVAEIVCYEQDPIACGNLEVTIAAAGLSKVKVVAGAEPSRTPFADSSFDMVICRYAMHHFPDQPAVMREVWRCLRPGGTLVYSDPAMPQHSRDTTHGLYCLRDSGFHGYRTYHEMLDSLRECGFEVLMVRPYDYQRGTIGDYLQRAGPVLRDGLTRAWHLLDDKTKRELQWVGEEEARFITYPVVDIAARKPDRGQT